jgi:hypothetical protein
MWKEAGKPCLELLTAIYLDELMQVILHFSIPLQLFNLKSIIYCPNVKLKLSGEWKSVAILTDDK